ncbi:hypothetical protein CCR83_08660 [Rhodobacter veldkampii DSM 11550]|uniref:hypothetical protein n=1 Tax=Phaeovulum veldkampii TaxID=33049 RepID=UPI0010E5A39D|nr:hypothetical protein [Phaeovulum veldkampii]MBK5946498.1 hypothetical protein [Phaeovulum veldkampii DSM 11550]TDQ54599.1 hypothetical protein EV658_1304 [Phaeovulum veldkampii DSM 11550]
MKAAIFRSARLSALAVPLLGTLAGGSMAQSYDNAGIGWTGSMGFPGASDRSVRLQAADLMKKAESGYYGTLGSSPTQNNYYDSSVSMDVNVGDGSNAEISNHTAEGSGVNSYSVGSVNTTTNDISIDGSGSSVSVVSTSNSTGCIDGSISAPGSSGYSTFDISAGGWAESGSCD